MIKLLSYWIIFPYGFLWHCAMLVPYKPGSVFVTKKLQFLYNGLKHCTSYFCCVDTACVKMDAYSVNAFPPVTEALVALYF